MSLLHKYYFQRFTENTESLNSVQKKKLDKLLYEEGYENFISENNYNYLILCGDILIGFFSLIIYDNCIKITCLYVFSEYREKSVATGVINDIVFTSRHNFNKDIKYIVSNSFVESTMFFLKKRF